MKYTRLPLSADDQIDLLVSRGMEITDRDRVLHYLPYNRFRLRGDWIPIPPIVPSRETNCRIL